MRRHDVHGYVVQGDHAHAIGRHHETAREAVGAIRAWLANRRLTATVSVYGPDMALFLVVEIGCRP